MRITYSSALLKDNFDLFKRSIKLISHVCGLSFSYTTNLVRETPIKASSDFAARILGDQQHLPHEDLSKAKSRFKLLPSKTDAYRTSTLPALSRVLVDRGAELSNYTQEVS